jgi:hypothetical protein
MLRLLTYLASGVVARVVCICVARYIHGESDGGGWDAGTLYRFYPNLPSKYSINYDNMGAFYYNRKVQAAFWFASAVFAPWWCARCLIWLGVVVCWFFRDKKDQSWRSEYANR